jgi:hypothetical protein
MAEEVLLGLGLEALKYGLDWFKTEGMKPYRGDISDLVARGDFNSWIYKDSPIKPLSTLNPHINPLKPLLTPLQPLIPSVPLSPTVIGRAFDRNNISLEQPSILIYNDGKSHNKQPHPSSKPLGNAAMPYNSQGFTKKIII